MNRFYILLLFFFLAGFTAFGQAFKLYELDRYAKDTTTAPLGMADIVEINSTLYITFDKTAIADAIRDFTGADVMAPEQLKRLKAVLTNQVELLSAFKSYSADPNLNSLDSLAQQMNSFFVEAEKLPEIIDLYNEYSAQYSKTYTRAQIRNEAGKGAVPFRDEFIFTEMAKKATELAGEIEGNLSQGKVTFLLSGRLMTNKGEREVKLSDDFDSFKPQGYSVPRWQTELSEDSKQDLRQIGSLTNQLNNLLDVKEDDIKNWLKESFQAGDCLHDLADQLLNIPQIAQSIVPAAAPQVKEEATAPYRQAKRLSDQYTDNLVAAPGITSVDLLVGLNNDLSGTADSIDNLLNTMDVKLITLLKQLPSNPQIQQFIGTYDSCKVKLQTDRNKILKISERLTDMFGNARDAARAAAGISDQVRRLSFDDIPDEAYIDLVVIGPRDNGDRLNIRAILEVPGENGALPVRKIIDQRIFAMQQIGMFSTVKPMLLLAAPNGSGNNVDLEGKHFQFGPSYSILFKWGSRRSKFFNEVFSPGIGVNFGALDFDTDAVPEFGAALEFTFLRDYFSFGYGYNFIADEPFFLVGLRLPVGAIPLPIFNDVKVK